MNTMPAADMSCTTARRAAHPSDLPRAVSLSPRESEVLTLMEKGFTADEAATLMRVSRHTVVTFVRRIYLKLDVGSKAEAIFEARNLGLLQA